ncbi:hypothetical protein QFZ94_007365 [Paraburkholderia sp. JPY465]|uniref:hypothetical protein n=1 Tax=Paraburkholderia sp. JPY465 TaxID=3042285 RepID=UPI003D21FB5E
MQRTYPYKGFEITVDLELVWESSGSAVLSPPTGFVAIVSIEGKGLPASLGSPIRLMKDTQKPFGTEATALMTGCSAGQRVIDDMLLREYSSPARE